MSATVSGIHHVTAYAHDPQENIDFYTGVLGLRLVKQTVLFNNPSGCSRARRCTTSTTPTGRGRRAR
jgi:catechol 2,3-dioxygenase-like lactoylglutathione lyase family enzyme